MFLIIIAALCLNLADSTGFPPALTKCHFDDETCLLTQAHKFLRVFEHGCIERGMPDLEPINLGFIKVNTGNQRAITFDLSLSDTKLYNFTKMNISAISGFTNDTTKPFTISMINAVPEMYISAKYSVNGKLLILPIISSGDLTMELANVESVTSISIEPVKRNDIIYIKITDYKIVTKLSGLKLDMTNLFNNEQELRISTLKILNENWEVLSLDVQPKINEALENKLRYALNRFVQNIPYDEYFL